MRLMRRPVPATHGQRTASRTLAKFASSIVSLPLLTQARYPLAHGHSPLLLLFALTDTLFAAFLSSLGIVQPASLSVSALPLNRLLLRLANHQPFPNSVSLTERSKVVLHWKGKRTTWAPFARF